MQGSLTDGTVFDSSVERGDPISFKLGQGQVIKVNNFLTSASPCYGHVQAARGPSCEAQANVVSTKRALRSTCPPMRDGTQQLSRASMGHGQTTFVVVQGWDQGIAGMCVGEKRKLRIPASLGYGEAGSPPKIPGTAAQFNSLIGKLYTVS